MPISKKKLAEDEVDRNKAERGLPENVAARALAHRAQQDVTDFWKQLRIRFEQSIKEEIATLLPQIAEEVDRAERVSFSRSFGSENVSIVDLMLGVAFYAQGTAYDFTLSLRHPDDATTFKFLFQERIYALAQELLKSGDDEGCDEV